MPTGRELCYLYMVWLLVIQDSKIKNTLLSVSNITLKQISFSGRGYRKTYIYGKTMGH